MAEYIRRDDAVCAIREFSKTAVGIATEALVWAENVILDIVPSADVAEVRHGEWEENSRTSISERHRQIHYSIYKCSRCNHANGRYKSNFCPNCGADMREES